MMILTNKIPEMIDPQATYSTNGQEAWRLLGIMAEFATATERLRGVRPAVSMREVQAPARAGHRDVREAPLLLEAVVLRQAVLVREKPFLEAGDEDGVELESLG